MKILVVEDNRDIAENIADYFERLGHQLDFASDGLQGLDLALANDFDVIVLDIMLPRLDGLSFCRLLRDNHKATPVIMLTARDQLDDKLDGFKAGADDYLVKPFSVKELEARLHALLKRLDNFGQNPKLHVGELSFDLNTLAVTRNNTPIELNPIQRKLLEHLMRKSPNVVKREELEMIIWGDAPPDKDLLRSHIYSLRTLLDKPFDKAYIQTVHGVGYRLVTN